MTRSIVGNALAGCSTESSPVPLYEATQHFIEFRGMLSVREIARAVKIIHSRIVVVPCNERSNNSASREKVHCPRFQIVHCSSDLDRAFGLKFC